MTDWVDVESNNGGRGFARNVEKQCREMGNTKPLLIGFVKQIINRCAYLQNQPMSTI